MYIKAVIQFQQQDEKGKYKTVRETYLVDAVSWTEAEARIYEEIAPSQPDFTIKRMDPMKLADLFLDDSIDDKYLCKVVYITEDDRGKEKKINVDMLVSANDVPGAHAKINEELKTMLIPFEVKDVKKSPILEFFQYQPKNA